MTFLSPEVLRLEGERYFGLDLAKRETQLAVLDNAGSQVQQKRFATSRTEFLRLASELRETDTVALEVTTNSTSIARLIRDNSSHGVRIIISNPIKTRIIAEARWLLIEAAEALRKAPGPMRALFTRVRRRSNHNVAVVAVSRKLAELAHHLLTHDEDYLYKQHKLTQDKRSKVRRLARQKIGVRVASAARNSGGRTALYGLRTNANGTRIKNKIVRQAALQAERLYEALVRQEQHRQSDQNAMLIDRSNLVFDPTRPNETDWERILAQVAEKVIAEHRRIPNH